MTKPVHQAINYLKETMSITPTQNSTHLLSAITQGLGSQLGCDQETLQTISYIATSYLLDPVIDFKSEARCWLGNQKISLEFPSIAELTGTHERVTWWGRYARLIPPHIPNYLKGLIQKQGAGKIAVDLGCGKSGATLALLEKEWRVICVDYSQKALDNLGLYALKANEEWLTNNQLMPICTRIETYQFPKRVDAVIANCSLIYCDPQAITRIITNIYLSLKPGGVFAGNFLSFSGSEEAKVARAERSMGAWFVREPNIMRLFLEQYGFTVSTRGSGGKLFPTPIAFIANKPLSG